MDWVVELTSGILIIMLFVIPLINYLELPATIPTHFNMKGEVDGYGHKSTIWVLPMIGVIMYIGFVILNKYPHIFNYPLEITEENAKRQYTLATRLIRQINLFTVSLFVYLETTIISAVKSGGGSGFSMISIPIILIGSLIPIVVYLYQVNKTQSST
ncbi:MAG: DUF1648 domain-containing protein [Cyclobacteriaceae bacterium]|nr:DUF1648 domain-containing protein [Cyclobacteriaceae bacterium HetDA_MAG_MS6]